ncbi:DUF5999 family protein [Streptomyces sp. NPDC004647]
MRRATPSEVHTRSLLCNGFLLFDTGELLPNGRIIDSHRSAEARPGAAA